MEGMEKQLTAVEWLVKEFSDILGPMVVNNMQDVLFEDAIVRAKEMEKNIAEEYAEFCIRCDRANLPIIKFEDWIKELTFK